MLFKVRRHLLLAITIAYLCEAIPLPAYAQAITILHSFRDGSLANDGYDPFCGLILGRDGNFYGTTHDGGSTVSGRNSSGYGTVYRMTPTGAVTILHSFGDGTVTNDGVHPQSALVEGLDGNFYGTTYLGGSTVPSDPNGQGFGTVFKITPSGVLTILHSFGDGTVANDGLFPSAPLIRDPAGDFYGTTMNGGSVRTAIAPVGEGAVFKITPAGAVTLLHSFGDGSTVNDGGNPFFALVQGLDGNFYGMGAGFGAGNSGTVFKMTPSGQVTTLHSFRDGTVLNDGIEPTAMVQTSNGDFYGTTSSGGSTFGFGLTGQGSGTLFKMTPSGSVSILHSFSDGSGPNDGNAPTSLVIGSDGNFYGTTIAFGPILTGTLFRGTSTGQVITLHVFNDGSVANDGALPEALFAGVQGRLYGTSAMGGRSGNGTVFVVDLRPAPTTGLTATARNGMVILSWTADPVATSYNIYRSVTSGGQGGSVPLATGICGTRYYDRTVLNGTRYYYRIAAVDGAGTSGFSAEATALPVAPLVPPSGLVAVARNTGAYLTWNTVGSVSSYSVYRSAASAGEGGSTPIAAGLISPSYTDSGLTNGRRYFYRVTALNAGGNSGFSKEATVVPAVSLPVSHPPTTSYNIYSGLASACGAGLLLIACVYRGSIWPPNSAPLLF